MSTTPLADKVAQLERELAEAKKQLEALPKPLQGFRSGKFYSKKSDKNFIFFVTNTSNSPSADNYSRSEILEGRKESSIRRVSAILVSTGHSSYRKGLLLSSAMPLPDACVEVQGTLTFTEIK